jgi:hypothetical protein
LAGAVIVAMTGCIEGMDGSAEGGGEKTASTAQAIVYGIDNQQDVALHPDPSLRTIAMNAVATVVPTTSVNLANPNNVTFNNVRTLQQEANLCDTPSQRFASDPSVRGSCSATLIDDDLILTAGHCELVLPCKDMSFVFNFRRDPNGLTHTVTSADVFRCVDVVAIQRGSISAPADYAILRLDRSATPRFSPASVRVDRSILATGQNVAMIGSPLGTPHKIDSGGRVLTPLEAGTSFLLANLDAFSGNSGSGVFEMESYQLAGILGGGSNGGMNADIIPGPAGSVPAGCNVVATCGELGDGCTVQGGEEVQYVGVALDDFCTKDPTNARLCQPRTFLDYGAINTANATTDTFKQQVFLEPGATLDFGTCAIPEALDPDNSDTFIRLFSPDGVEVANNDDGGGSCGLASHATFTVPPLRGGLYEIRGGCFGNNLCGAGLAYTVSGPTGGSFSYFADTTNGALQNTRDFSINLRQGETLIAGTCGLEHAGFTGDTFLRVFSGAQQVAFNDDAAGCGLGSELAFTATTAGPVTLRAGCFGAGSCEGRVTYTIGVSRFVFSVANTASATQNTANQTVVLAAGDRLTFGTCGLPSTTLAGDTFLRVFLGTTEVALSDDACLGLGSLLSFTAATAGTYSVRAGCFAGNTCSGTAAFEVTRRGAAGGTFSYAAAVDTNSATQNTTNGAVFLRRGDSVQIGTCPGVPGASGTGDTLLRLFGPNGLEVTNNDDACGLQSQLSFTAPIDQPGAYEIRAGCFGSNTCSGTVGFVHQ